IALSDQAVGMIRIYFSDQQDLSDTDLDFIITVADQCACVIERIKYMENQQKKFNQLAIRMEKMSSLGRMAAGIAHEINNPLAGILLYSSNLSKKVPKDGPVKEGLEIIMKETQRCKGIIQDLLEFARDRESEKSEVDVNSIVETAVGILDNEFLCQHVKVEKKLADNMIKINLDKNQIEQVIINLLLNALEAVEANKGRIMIKTSIDQPQNRIRIEIEDNGYGIPHENVENIFDPFFSTKSNGTGLGLSVSYGIIQSHHGEIKVFSEEGQGTRFTIELPIRPDKK
ncbi:MAG: sensor histidine kinase, partial [Desulfosalsimonas sp.]